MRNGTKTKFFVIILGAFFAGMVGVSDACAETHICKVKYDSWLQRYYDIQFLEVNVDKRWARFGSSNSWMDSQPLRVTDQSNGRTLSWTQTLKRVDKNESYDAEHKFVVRKSGKIHFSIWWKGYRSDVVSLECKTH
jgi:hypothetical protein